MKKRILFKLFILILLVTICKPKPKEKPKELKIRTEAFSLKSGQTLAKVLEERIGDSQKSTKIIQNLGQVGFNFKKCKPGDSLIFFYTDERSLAPKGRLHLKKISYRINYERIYEIFFDSLGCLVAMVYKEFQVSPTVIKGVIGSSLFESMVAIGLPYSVIGDFADILSWEIDFFVETFTADSFYLLIDKKFSLADSSIVDYGRIHLLRYKGKIGDFYGIYFVSPNGIKDYYDLKGNSLRKAFLKSPLRYSRISSRFSKGRYHPILRIVRPHYGVDYVAPKGTPVSAIGDGIVIFKGIKGGYGKLVEINHKGGFKSRYGHLSRFGPGIKRGVRVRQGARVGYVGATGLATGPHLHFELLKNGVWVNPLKVIIPRAEPVKKEYLPEFFSKRDSLLAILSQ